MFVWIRSKIKQKEAGDCPFEKTMCQSIWAVFVAHLVEQLLPKPEIRGSRSVVGNFIIYQLY